MKHILAVILSVLVLSFFMACTESGTQKESAAGQGDTITSVDEKASDVDTKKDSLTLDEEQPMDEKVQETAQVSKYICPNSCPEGHADHSGNCSTCGMELIENPDYSESPQ
jgi:hypothetical protein